MHRARMSSDSSSRKAVKRLIGMHNETLAVAAMRVSNPNCSPL
jgi:hypothetical protein